MNAFKGWVENSAYHDKLASQKLTNLDVSTLFSKHDILGID